MRILLVLFYTFFMVLVLFWSFPSFSWQAWYCGEKLDAGHYWALKGQRKSYCSDVRLEHSRRYDQRTELNFISWLRSYLFSNWTYDNPLPRGTWNKNLLRLLSGCGCWVADMKAHLRTGLKLSLITSYTISKEPGPDGVCILPSTPPLPPPLRKA